MSDRHEKRVLAGAMALAGCKSIGQFNELFDLQARRYLRTADIVLNAADAYEKRGCTPEEYLAATKGS